jgi:hypothetical protein
MAQLINTNASELQYRWTKRLLDVNPELRALLEKRLLAIEAKAIQYSSTQYASTKELRQMGHPYAINMKEDEAGNITRLPFHIRAFLPGASLPGGNAAYLNPQGINEDRRSESLHQKWHTEIKEIQDTLVGIVFNDASYAKYMEGESPREKMINRPILTLAVNRVDKSSLYLSLLEKWRNYN